MTAKNEILVKKFFKWEFKNFNCNSARSSNNRGTYLSPYDNSNITEYFNLPGAKTYDHYNNVNREAVLRLNPKTNMLDVTITPRVNDMKCYFVYENGTKYDMKTTPLTIGKCTLCVDVVIPITVFRASIVSLSERLRIMYADDPNAKFIIICQSEAIEAIKPILAASSPVFKAMFDSGMKEANENSMEIKDFDPVIVKKMVEFCETDQLADFEGLEMELLQIAHKYQIQDLTNYAMEEIVRTTTKENHCDRWYVAHQYGLKDLKKWFSNF